MKLARRYNTLVCATALLASLAYCAADDNTTLLAILSIVGCVIGWYAGRGDRPWALPRWVVNLLMLAAIVDATLKVLAKGAYTGFWSGAANTPIVSTLSQFLVYILLAKLFDRRGPRDEAHLISLSIFVVVGAVLTSNTLSVGIFVLLFAPCVICSAMLLQLVGGARAVEDWARAVDLYAGSSLDLPSSSRRRFRRDFVSAALIAVGGTLALATLAFVLMPRGLWNGVLGGFGKVDSGAVVGFTDQAQLGRMGLLQNQDNQSPVLNVRLTTTINNKTEDLGEIRGTLYLRGTVKNHYVRRSSSWELEPETPPRRPPRTEDRARDDLADITGGPTLLPGETIGFETTTDQPLRLGDLSRGQIMIRQEVTLLRPIRTPGYFFSIWRPLEFSTNQSTSVFYPGRELILRAAPSSPGSPSLATLQSYSVLTAMEYSDPREPAREKVAFDSDVVRSIAESILNPRDIPLDPEQRDSVANRRVALAFVDYLRTGFQYSRDMTAPEPGEDPIEMFLSRTKSGHCEYFASAMVALCQSVGLDARYIAGYLATEFNSVTGVYVVRESNAHAWAEVRLAPGRWQTFDPSPPDAIERIHRRPTGLLTRIRQWYDAINFTWSSAVVSFDVSKQERIVGAPQGWAGRAVRRVTEAISALRQLPSSIALAFRLAMLALVLVVVGVIVRRLWRGKRIARSVRTAHQEALAADPALARLLDQAGFYTDALDLLRRSDLAKPAHRPPILHARAIGPAVPTIARPLGAIADLYYRLRFGRRALSPEELAEAQSALSSLGEHLRRHNTEALLAARDAAPRAR